ncbi:MAG: ferrous iron transport protein B [Proteobacteria bacterium]|nr:ferrous iron transport protein B [Pseudomonadota bacterium]
MNETVPASTESNPVLTDPKPSSQKRFSVAVAGNPNAGKSTLINALAGTRLQVGNWPGVTVEKKEAVLKLNDRTIRLVDLPGTYSLSPYTEEEVIARDFLLHERPDAIVNVVDTTNLERNLFLTIQLLELEIPIIIVLNMYDEIESKGYRVDAKAIEKILSVRAIPVIAVKKRGIDALLTIVSEVLEYPENHQPRELHYSEDIEAAVQSIVGDIENKNPALTKVYPLKWLAYKILEKDRSVLDGIGLNPDDFLNDGSIDHLRTAHDENFEAFISEARYAQTAGLAQEVLSKPLIPKIEITEKIDKLVLNRFLGLPIFFAVMWLTFKLTFDVSTPFVEWIDSLATGPLTRWSTALLDLLRAPDWLSSLLVEGIIGGVGFVLVFVPVIFCMMFFITFLEGCGYMARAAFVMDRYMHFIGLHGKSFIPMIIGFGCNVPGVYATRTLENKKDKTLTALLLPLMSCGARLPVYILFIGAFFQENKGTILFSIYLLGIALAVLMGVLFRKTLFRGEAPVFIMELPPYRLPSIKNLLIHTWEKAKHFIVKAGTYILAMSVLIWFALNLPWGVENKKDSYLGKTAQVIAPIFQPLGFGRWEIASSLLTGIVAKEIVISTMGVIYTSSGNQDDPEESPSFGEDLVEIVRSFLYATKDAAVNVVSTFWISSISTEEEEESVLLRSVIRKQFTPLSAYAFMAFVLLYMPCIVTGVAMRQEFGSWKWFFLATFYGMILAWTVAFIIFQGGTLIGLGA